ncbi:helix-turn-helix transcriptional regulator [Streptosporangium sp. NPDC048865]|uniref:helix-turn-helix transcriptional regulator n=1 Tax=Streptosporangium sp. NPDC048865 TaxID=3155766 RepID=UPI003439BA38
MDSDNLLGEFLRARRELTTPEQVGLLPAGSRRTPGLRREEVAMLAGVSTDYYIRLEQGRERHPSERVLGALMQVLNLSADASAHMHRLAHPWPLRPSPADQPDRAKPAVVRLIRSWPYTPAIVTSRWMDVLASNQMADALYEGLEHRDNLLRLIFLNPASRRFYRDWDECARSKVAQLRAIAGADLDDPYLTDLVGELSLKSKDFRRMWARHDVSSHNVATKRFRHHDVGDLTLTYEMFNINDSPGQKLIVFQAEPGSPSAHALDLLGSLAALASP